MNNFTVLNYQGSKNNLRDFIYKNLKPYIKEGKAVFDIFSGSASVSSMFGQEYLVYANDAEAYASIIADALLNPADIPSPSAFLEQIEADYAVIKQALCIPVLDFINREKTALKENNYRELSAVYDSYPTVWNQKYSDIIQKELTVENIRAADNYYLFTTYYASNYYGIGQALEIDCIIKLIHTRFPSCRNALLMCLFYAMKETVFSKDGHMAQPLNPEKNQRRLFLQRGKCVYELFIRKLQEYLALPLPEYSGKNRVFNKNFEELLTMNIFSDVGLVYADPPYTDMQYSRYYHLLNVAVRYEYPDLTRSRNGYTKGLYTEGRYQSKLSQRSSAGKSLERLISFCAGAGVNLALSYAYPQDRKKQATDRYTISIDELIRLARKHFSPERVTIAAQSYSHANHRNSTQKKVVEYLILCGDKTGKELNYDTLKKQIANVVPSKNNAMYNSHMYWSQKAYNICDILIQTLSDRGGVVFDPFLGSGVTALEAIRDDTGRKAVGCDINDMPVFISRTLLSVNSIGNIREILDDFLEKLTPLTRYYRTTCPVCHKTGTISKVLFDKPDRQKNVFKIKTVYYSCPCTKKGVKEPDEEDRRLMQTVPVLENITDTALLANSKIAVSENDDIRNIFTGRNLAVLNEILTIIRGYEDRYQNILKYILMSVLHLCKITDRHSNSQWPLWIPKTDCVEKNIIEILSKKVHKFNDVIAFMKENYSHARIVSSYDELQPGSCLLLQKGCQNITGDDIPDGGADLIITDPPYLEQVLYSEYMQLYKPFLGFGYNLADEIVVSSAPSRDKNREDYFRLLDQAFDMCSRKLKLHRHMCLYFHDCSLDVWNRLITILESRGFRFITQIHIRKTVTLKNIISPKKSLNGDSILIFSKEDAPVVHHTETEDIAEIETAIIRQSRAMIRADGPQSTPELYDNGLMGLLIQNGWLAGLSQKYSSLVDIFEKHLTWDSQTGKWMI